MDGPGGLYLAEGRGGGGGGGGGYRPLSLAIISWQDVINVMVSWPVP